jgi:hypothetical protein
VRVREDGGREVGQGVGGSGQSVRSRRATPIFESAMP